MWPYSAGSREKWREFSSLLFESTASWRGLYGGGLGVYSQFHALATLRARLETRDFGRALPPLA